MKKLILLICVFYPIFMTAFCTDIDLSDQQRYKLMENYSTATYYIDKNSLNVLRYNPPYYIIQGDSISKYYYDNEQILRVTYKFYYDYNFKEIKWQYVLFTEYDKNGNFLGSYTPTGPISNLKVAEKGSNEYFYGWSFFILCYNIPFSEDI